MRPKQVTCQLVFMENCVVRGEFAAYHVSGWWGVFCRVNRLVVRSVVGVVGGMDN